MLVTPSEQGNDSLKLILALFRYYGAGHRTNVGRQIFSRAANYFSDSEAKIQEATWIVYRRLADFGLIVEVGDIHTPVWQWEGDKVRVLRDGRLVLCSLMKDDPEFSGLFSAAKPTEVVSYRMPLKYASIGSLNFFVGSMSDQVEGVLQSGSFETVCVGKNSASVMLPSIEECLKSLVISDADTRSVSLEFSDAGSQQWAAEIPRSRDGYLPARARKEHGGGFRYFVCNPRSGVSHEVLDPDWLHMLAWSQSGTQWTLLRKADQSTYFPEWFFLRCPSLLRQSIVQQSMLWPARRVESGQTYYAATDVSEQHIRSLCRIYPTVLRVRYER